MREHPRRVECPIAVEHGDKRRREGDDEAGPADAVQSRGKLRPEEGGQLAEHIAAGAGKAQAGAGQGQGQSVSLHGLPRRGLDRGELAGSGLVALDQPVGFAASESPLRAEPGKLVPLIAVRGGVGIEIHLFRY